jgi:hypothetical protein
MNKIVYLLFAIPAISVVVIALSQVFDEMSKKRFILERRAEMSADQASAVSERRRYSDPVPPGTLRNPETATSSTTTEGPMAQVHGV